MAKEGDQPRAGVVRTAKGKAGERSGLFEEVSWSRPGFLDDDATRPLVQGGKPSGWLASLWPKRSWKWLTPIALLGFLIPAFLWAYDHIEDDIQDAGRAILIQEGIPTEGLTFDATYRNIEVGGTLPAGVTAEQIEETLEETNWDWDGEDVRNVSVTAAAAAVAAAPELAEIDVDVVSTDGQTILLTGAVPSEAHETALVEAAEATGLQVEENITVRGLDPSAEDADGQIARMAAVVGGLAVGGFASAELAIDDSGPVTGRIVALDADGAGSLGALVAAENIEVEAPAELAPLDVDVNYDGTRIVLNGTVFDDAERDELVAAAAGVVGEENVVNNLEVTELGAAVAGSSSRVAAFSTAIGTFDGLISGEGSLSDTDLTINGVAPDEAGQAATIAAIEASADADLRPGGEVTVDAPDVSLEEEVELLQAELDALQDEIRENVVFASNSDELTPVAQGTLDKVRDAMQRFTRPVVEVGGHTDSQGNDEFNLDLSQRRTDSVVAYLSNAGVDVSRLQGIGFGESQPVADNLTEEGRLQNRRVAFVARPSFE